VCQGNQWTSFCITTPVIYFNNTWSLQTPLAISSFLFCRYHLSRWAFFSVSFSLSISLACVNLLALSRPLSFLFLFSQSLLGIIQVELYNCYADSSSLTQREVVLNCIETRERNRVWTGVILKNVFVYKQNIAYIVLCESHSFIAITCYYYLHLLLLNKSLRFGAVRTLWTIYPFRIYIHPSEVLSVTPSQAKICVNSMRSKAAD
jgi:hypothetical protein